jgi:hypothetical protein
MLLLSVLASAAHVEPRRDATATVRIERPSIVRRDTWNAIPRSRRREVTIRDEQGRELLLRLIENE